MNKKNKSAILVVALSLLSFVAFALSLLALENEHNEHWTEVCAAILVFWTPAAVLGFAWKFSHVFRSGWARLVSSTWGLWAFFVFLSDDFWKATDIAWFAIIVPGLIVFLASWVAIGFQRSGRTVQHPTPEEGSPNMEPDTQRIMEP